MTNSGGGGIVSSLVDSICGNLLTDLMEWLAARARNTAAVRAIEQRINPEQTDAVTRALIRESIDDVVRESPEIDFQAWLPVLKHHESRKQIIAWTYEWRDLADPEIGPWTEENLPQQDLYNGIMLKIRSAIQGKKRRYFGSSFYNIINEIVKGNDVARETNLVAKDTRILVEQLKHEIGAAWDRLDGDAPKLQLPQPSYSKPELDALVDRKDILSGILGSFPANGILGITGETGGIGKSSVIHAFLCEKRYTADICYIQADSMATNLEEIIVQSFSKGINGDLAPSLGNLTAIVAALKKHNAREKYFVIDGADTSTAYSTILFQLDELRRHDWKIIIGTRLGEISGLDIMMVPLSELEESHAVELFRKEYVRHRDNFETNKANVVKLVQKLSYHPLLVKIFASSFVNQAVSVTKLIEEIDNSEEIIRKLGQIDLGTGWRGRSQKESRLIDILRARYSQSLDEIKGVLPNRVLICFCLVPDSFPVNLDDLYELLFNEPGKEIELANCLNELSARKYLSPTVEDGIKSKRFDRLDSYRMHIFVQYAVMANMIATDRFDFSWLKEELYARIDQAYNFVVWGLHSSPNSEMLRMKQLQNRSILDIRILQSMFRKTKEKGQDSVERADLKYKICVLLAKLGMYRESLSYVDDLWMSVSAIADASLRQARRADAFDAESAACFYASAQATRMISSAKERLKIENDQNRPDYAKADALDKLGWYYGKVRSIVAGLDHRSDSALRQLRELDVDAVCTSETESSSVGTNSADTSITQPVANRLIEHLAQSEFKYKRMALETMWGIFKSKFGEEIDLQTLLKMHQTDPNWGGAKRLLLLAQIYHNLSVTHGRESIEDIGETISNANSALKIRQELLGNHPETAKTNVFVAQCYERKANYHYHTGELIECSRALEEERVHKEVAHAQRTTLLRADHPDVGKACMQLALTYSRLYALSSNQAPPPENTSEKSPIALFDKAEKWGRKAWKIFSVIDHQNNNQVLLVARILVWLWQEAGSEDKLNALRTDTKEYSYGLQRIDTAVREKESLFERTIFPLPVDSA